MYHDSIVPNHWPGGGGFSVTKITLASLYEDHLRCRNWWTSSNEDLPLCRYTGTKIRLYQCKEADYVVKIETELPGHSNKLTYPSCQSSMMLMSRNKVIVPSERNKKLRKGYKTIFVKPPPQFTSEWYFQVDMYKHALMVIYTSAVSLDNYFLKPNVQNGCITFNTLNCTLIQNRKMGIQTNESWPYKTFGTVSHYMYLCTQEPMPANLSDIQLGKLIPLCNPRIDTAGLDYHTAKTQEGVSDFKTYTKNWYKYYGNIFNQHIILEEDHLVYTIKSPEGINTIVQSKNLTETSKWSELTEATNFPLNKVDDHIFNKLQYNPNTDTGKDTQVYLLPNTDGNGWDPPSNEDLILEGFPLWLILVGFVDFQIKIKKYNNIQTKCILCIKSKSTFPIVHIPIVPLGDSFITGKSPYENDILPADKLMWYPMVEYQEEEINKIVSSGPGTPFLPTYKQENITAYAKSYFKWGGSPPKHVTVENPAQQEIYPIPGNQSTTISLQNPATAPETTLYSFDFRRNFLTRSAQTRITEDPTTQTFISSITEPTTRANLQRTIQELQVQENLQTQAEKETLIHLKQLREYQQCLREQMFAIMNNLQL